MSGSVFAHYRGVVLADPDTPWDGVPLHFGDPSGEQWALEAGTGIVQRGDLAVVGVAGPDRKTWLTSISSQALNDLRPGESRELLILDAQGHIEHAAGVVDDGQVAWLVTPRSRADAFAQWLDSMRFMLRVTIERPEVSVFQTVTPGGQAALGHMAAPVRKDPGGNSGAENASAVSGTGPGSAAHATPDASADSRERPARDQGMTWVDPWPGVVSGGAAYWAGAGQHPGAEHVSVFHLVPAHAAQEFADAWLASDPGRQPVGLLAAEAMRVAAWRPSIEHEVDTRCFPAELDWLRTAVHTDKGCYPGQESVAHILNMGRPPRRLTQLQLDGSTGDLPQAGAVLQWNGRDVGVITSAVRHADQGPIALALINRSVPADVIFDIDGIAAAQELIVPLEGRPVGLPQPQRPTLKANPALRRGDMRGSMDGGLAPAKSTKAAKTPAGATRLDAAVSESGAPARGVTSPGGVAAGAASSAAPAGPDVAESSHTPRESTPTTQRFHFEFAQTQVKPLNSATNTGAADDDPNRTPDGFVKTPAGAQVFGFGGKKGGHRGAGLGVGRTGR